MEDKEIWKPFPDYEDFYEVSNFGRVRRIKQVPGTRCGKILKIHKNTSGYPIVVVSRHSKERTVMVHRAVARAFIEPVEGKPYVNHIDGDKTNNVVDNLEWVTMRENHLHSLYDLDNIKSHRHFSDEQILAIRNDDRTQSQIAKDYGVCQATIGMIRRGITYKDVGGPITKTNRAEPHRLTYAQVLEIRSSPESDSVLAQKYDVAPSTIRRIRNYTRRCVK